MKLAILLLCIEAIPNSIHKEAESPTGKTFEFEGQAGLLGAGLSVGALNRELEVYSIKAVFDNYIQSSMASLGIHYKTFFTDGSYFEPGIGGFKMWLDENKPESSGLYASTAFGMKLSGSSKGTQFGIEWTTLSILYSTGKNEAYVNATLPKLTLATKF